MSQLLYFWEARIPVFDIAASSPATLLGRWQYSWKYHTMWCRSILTAAWAFDVWTSSDDLKQILQNIPVLLLILFSRDTTLGYIRGCFSFKVKQKVTLIWHYSPNALLFTCQPFLIVRGTLGHDRYLCIFYHQDPQFHTTLFSPPRQYVLELNLGAMRWNSDSDWIFLCFEVFCYLEAFKPSSWR